MDHPRCWRGPAPFFSVEDHGCRNFESLLVPTQRQQHRDVLPEFLLKESSPEYILCLYPLPPPLQSQGGRTMISGARPGGRGKKQYISYALPHHLSLLLLLTLNYTYVSKEAQHVLHARDIFLAVDELAITNTEDKQPVPVFCCCLHQSQVTLNH